MSHAARAPPAKRARTDAGVPKSKFDIGDIVVIAATVADDNGKFWSKGFKIEDKVYCHYEWVYQGVSKTEGGVEVLSSEFEGLLKKPDFAIGQRIGLGGNGNMASSGTVVGYQIDECNRVRHNISWDRDAYLQSELIKFDN